LNQSLTLNAAFNPLQSTGCLTVLCECIHQGADVLKAGCERLKPNGAHRCTSAPCIVSALEQAHLLMAAAAAAAAATCNVSIVNMRTTPALLLLLMQSKGTGVGHTNDACLLLLLPGPVLLLLMMMMMKYKCCGTARMHSPAGSKANTT
jgi:hypothetical protein